MSEYTKKAFLHCDGVLSGFYIIYHYHYHHEGPLLFCFVLAVVRLADWQIGRTGFQYNLDETLSRAFA